MSEMYTERLLDHYHHPRNRGRLASPDLSGEEYNALCGDRVRIEVRVQEGWITEAWFDGRGCALCLGAASILTEMITDPAGPAQVRAFALDRVPPRRVRRRRIARGRIAP
jgi:NifU-like protein involved in Fe-S cluster formation